MATRPQYDSIQTVRIPFIAPTTNRDPTTTKGQRFVNCYFDVTVPIDGEKVYNLVKRPGTTQTTQPSGATGVGRGTYSWKGDLYSVVGTKLYKNTTDLGVTLTTSTGRCGIAETHPIATNQYLCINDGVKLYAIAAGTGTVTTVTTNFPNPNTTDLVHMDTYLFTLDAKGTLWQCDTNDPTVWNNTKFITGQMFNGIGVGLAHQSNTLIMFSDQHFQAFFDNANASGSVLNNIEQASQQVGCACQNSIQFMEGNVIWVSNQKDGGYAVYMMGRDVGLKKVSTAHIERVLRNEGTSISSVLGNYIRVAGHTFYLLTLPSDNRTYVYDIDMDWWCEWQDSDGVSKFPMVSFTQHLNVLRAQHQSDGWVYSMSESTTQDNGVNFTVLARFKRFDLDDDRRKFVRKAELVGDMQATTTLVSLSYFDDDFLTQSTIRLMDMSLVRAFAMNLGNFRRRVWQISYAGANPLRLQYLELKLRLGTN